MGHRAGSGKLGYRFFLFLRFCLLDFGTVPTTVLYFLFFMLLLSLDNMNIEYISDI